MSGQGNKLQHIAIVGVSGTAGSRIVEEALKNPHFKITALTREDSNAKVPEGVNAIKVKYDDHASLVSALKGQDALIITMSVMAPPETQIKIIDAAAEAGVPWILPNEFGNDATEEVGRDTFLGPPMQKVRNYIESKGVSWIGVACGFWYEFSFAGGLERFGFDWKSKEAILFDGGDRRITTSTWAQVGKCVAALLALPIHKDASVSGATLDDFRNRFVHFGSFTVSQNDMLASIKRVKPEWEWKTSTIDVKEFYQGGMEQFQKGDRKGFSKCLYSRHFYPDNAGDTEARLGLDNDKLGVPKEDLDECTRRAVALFESGYFDQHY